MISFRTLKTIKEDTSEMEQKQQALERRKNKYAEELYYQFELLEHREVVNKENEYREVLLKCDLPDCLHDHRQDLGDKHQEYHEEKDREIQFVKSEAVKALLDELRSDNHDREEVVGVLTGIKIRNPKLTAEETKLREILQKLFKMFERKLKRAHLDLDHEEMECQRTRSKLLQMLQDRSAITENISHVRRCINLVGNVNYYNRELNDPKSRRFEENMKTTRLQLDQEGIVGDILTSKLEKELAILQNERADIVRFASNDIIGHVCG